MTQADHALRVGTMNVRTCSGRMAAIVDAARRDDVNILCIQESSRIMPDALKGLHSTCRALGFRLDVGPQDEHGGVAVLSDHPVARIALPDFLEFGHRVMAVQVSRTGIRPLMLVNVYVHANDKQLGTHLLQSVFQWLRSTGEDYTWSWATTTESRRSSLWEA